MSAEELEQTSIIIHDLLKARMNTACAGYMPTVSVLSSNPNTWTKKKWIELHHGYGNKCFVCGSSDRLQFAHIDKTTPAGPVSRYLRSLRERIRDIMRHPQAYALLCQPHHLLLDKTTKLQGSNPRKTLLLMWGLHKRHYSMLEPSDAMSKLSSALGYFLNQEEVS